VQWCGRRGGAWNAIHNCSLIAQEQEAVIVAAVVRAAWQGLDTGQGVLWNEVSYPCMRNALRHKKYASRCKNNVGAVVRAAGPGIQRKRDFKVRHAFIATYMQAL